MIKKSIIKALVLSAILFFANANSPAQTRINFKRGASSAEVTGSLPARGKRVYLINVAAGQTMTVEVTAGNRRVIVQINGAGYKVDNPEASNAFQGTVEGGEYRLTLYNNGRATQYKMGVSVE